MCDLYKWDETIDVENFVVTRELVAHTEVCEECKDGLVDTILLLIVEVESEKVS